MQKRVLPMQGKAAALPIDADAISKALERATRPEPVINLIADNHQPRPQWARPKEAAQHSGISVSTFWRYAKERADFPPLRRVGSRCTLIDLNQLDAWISKGGAA